MPNVQVKAWYKVVQGQPRKVERELLWYDSDKKEMIKYKGGKLLHTYGQKKDGTWGITTKVIDIYEPGLPEIDSKSLNAWYQIYCNYNKTEVVLATSLTDSVIFLVPEEELSDFVYAMDREQIKNMVM